MYFEDGLQWFGPKAELFGSADWVSGPNAHFMKLCRVFHFGDDFMVWGIFVLLGEGHKGLGMGSAW